MLEGLETLELREGGDDEDEEEEDDDNIVLPGLPKMFPTTNLVPEMACWLVM